MHSNVIELPKVNHMPLFACIRPGYRNDSIIGAAIMPPNINPIGDFDRLAIFRYGE